MAVILAYTAPALGHLFPFCALLTELASRGHQVHVRTLAAGVELCRQLGFDAEAVDPRIEALQSAGPAAGGVLRAAGNTVRVLGQCAQYEVDDFRDAVRDVEPDICLIDANSWGAQSAAETMPGPWVVLSPFIPYLRSPGSAPFGAGVTPRPGPVGFVRDWGIQLVTAVVFDVPFRSEISPVRKRLGLPKVRSAGQLLRRAPALLIATGKPFEYRHTDWGPNVELIGPAAFDPPPTGDESWLDDIDDPIVLVTTSSLAQADNELVGTAIDALEGLPVHVVATLPGGGNIDVRQRPGATLSRFTAHSAILDRTVCVITHGGMGITQKALARGIPVCVVPFGRDQFEVARRVEVARCGTRLPARRLTRARLRAAVEEAMTMGEGAATVAAGFEATGGVRHGADRVEGLLQKWPLRTPGR
ncbi:glycosyltransferase [Mycolicibacterium psychrotolerans]|uniref:glycosyltransferase n=1 Tax=Mycolicibacterium psychrotolerans TaxID=216929 RepID=UPI003D66B657